MWKTNGHKFNPDHGGLLVSYDKVGSLSYGPQGGLCAPSLAGADTYDMGRPGTP